MRKTITLLALTLVPLAVTACGGTSSSSASKSTTSATKAPFDRAFIDAMVPHHRSAIEMAEAAQKAGLASSALNGVARNIIDSQHKEIDEMLAWRKRWYGSRRLNPNAGESLGLSMDEMGMSHTSGDLQKGNVDGSFASMMVGHHEGAIRMARLAATRAQHSEIKQLARQIIVAQERELKIMKPLAHTGEGDHTMTGMNMG